MIFADTDFFLALLKPSDWLKNSANLLFQKHRGELFTTPAALTELLLLAVRFKLDPERLMIDVLEIAPLHGASSDPFLVAANFIKQKGAGTFDALHAAYCGTEGRIISSDKVFDRLGIERIPLAAEKR